MNLVYFCILRSLLILVSNKSNPTRVAFAASSRRIVDEFYLAAITAGGRSQGPPTEGQDEGTYYSARILDFNDNQIEVMYRSDAPRTLGNPPRGSEMQRISNWQNDVAYESEGRRTRHQTPESPKIIVNNITTTPGVEVYRVKQISKADGEISTRAIIGTIVGASAGAAVAYAMAKSESEKPAEVDQHHLTYRAIEAPPQRVTEVIYERPNSLHSTSRGIEMIDREADELRSKHSNSGSRVKTIGASQAHSIHEGTSRFATESHTGRTIAQTSGTKILAGEPEQKSKVSRGSHTKTIKMADSVDQARSSHSTALKSAKDVPLPPSKISTNLTPATNGGSPLNDLGTIVPDDSISQVSTRRSSRDRHSKHIHGSRHTRRSSHGSSRTVKASDRHLSKAGSHRR